MEKYIVIGIIVYIAICCWCAWEYKHAQEINKDDPNF